MTISRRKRWGPEAEWQKALDETIRWLKKSGQSEAVAIGDFLDDNYRDVYRAPDLALAILDEFAEWAMEAKKKLREEGGA